MDFNQFKEIFDKSFGKVTPEEFIKKMESLGYKFVDDFYCHNKCIANACEDYDFKKCKNQCEFCISKKP